MPPGAEAFLYVFAFFAGLIDSIAGGGGLIQLPALLILLPQVPVATLLGTNKLASICGTSVAAFQYIRHVRIDAKATLPAAILALIFSAFGAMTASVIRTDIMRTVIIVLLIAIAVYTSIRKDLGAVHAPRLNAGRQFFLSSLTGMIIGFYDGFFGPGTGSFLIIIFVAIFGFNFLTASASSKLINFATNLSAVIYFGMTGNILYHIAIPMALCNVIGALVGTRLAILKGSRFVRIFFLIVVTGMILRLLYDTFR